MMKLLCLTIFFSLISSCQGQKQSSNSTGSGPTRLPVFAGKFYPADSSKLAGAIKTFLADAMPHGGVDPIAIIVPHAGYIFAGQIIADGYNQARGKTYDVIVVLGTNHTTAGFEGIGVYPKGGFATPVGNAEIDDELADNLMKDDPDVISDIAVHAQEHSIEVQIPFIKSVFPGVKILPLIVGEPNTAMCTRFGKSLAKVLKGRHPLLVASSDLSHYPPFDEAVKVDNRTLKVIAGLDIKEIKSRLESALDEDIPQLSTCACGEAPIMAAVAAAKELGASSASIVSYTNSGYSPVGSTDRVVGYGAMVIGNGSGNTNLEDDTSEVTSSYVLTSADKKALLNYARKTLGQFFTTETVPLPRGFGRLLKVKRGAFVTLNKHGDLRGCVGIMSEDRPLCTVVGAMALQAAFNDRRFDPLSENELSQVEIEISVLTPFMPVKSADEIVLGRDGVLLKKGNKQGVFLPQVATETGWSKEVFLDQLCFKAGLSAGDWKSAELFTFQANVFSESQFEKPGD